jgi:protein-S-isoprenylcysteine O-methyltransferase Ste14
MPVNSINSLTSGFVMADAAIDSVSLSMEWLRLVTCSRLTSRSVRSVGGLALVSADLLILTGLATSVIFSLTRIPKEERMMLEKFGDQYRAYMKRTGRLLPLLRRNIDETEPARDE